MNVPERNTQVLIVGAGPTGLTTAIELARRGVDVRIVERRTEASTRSKALVVHARTLELFDLLGIADELVQLGYTSPGIDFSASEDYPLRASMYRLDTRFPFILIVPQATTEQMLERRLNEAGITVERGLRFIGLSQSQYGVRAKLENTDGRQITIASDYLVGADGPHSSVRDALDIPFEGSRYDWTATLGDVWIDGYHAEGGTEQHANNRGLAFIVPFKDGSHRIVTIDRRFQNQPNTRDLSIDDLQESISAILELPVTLRDPKWLTRWGAELKLAARYRTGRVFIGGDAAHTHSPAGGQGMNTGIQDAFNLGWKLALAVQTAAPATLLETYHAERHAVGQTILHTSDLLLRSLLLRRRPLRVMRQALFRMLVPLPPVQKTLSRNLSGLGVRYATGHGRMAGHRMPDLALRASDDRPVRLYSLLRFAGYTLLVFVNPTRARAHQGEIEALLRQTDTPTLQAYVVLDNGLPDRHRFARAADTLVDHRGEFETRLGAITPRMLLIRPDGYVALDLRALDASVFESRLRDWLPAAPAIGQ